MKPWQEVLLALFLATFVVFAWSWLLHSMGC